MGFSLGAVVAGVAAVAAICTGIRQIIEEVNNTMDEVDELIERLNADSEGTFKDTLVDACNWLKQKVDNMVESLNTMVDAIEAAMKQNETTDNEGASILKEARR